MEGLISAFILLFIYMSIWAFTTWRKLKNMERLNEQVAWSICESDGVRWNIPLWAHLKNAQLHSNVSEQYRISEDEDWQNAKEIIERFQKELTQSYFNGKLWALKSIYNISGKDYFLYILYVYLCDHDNGYFKNLVFNLKNREDRNVVFYKMYYITYMYCKNSLALQRNVPAWIEDYLKEKLDKEITL